MSFGLIILGLLLCLSGWITSAFALMLGIGIALSCGNLYADRTKRAASNALGVAIVGLGAGIPLGDVVSVGMGSVVYTIFGIGFTFAAGLALGRLLNIPKDISTLITSGTAICGGSAIAAISRTINARGEATAISLATVFLLNAAALVVFPLIGHALDLTQAQFGLWAGLAIHDTSSVVGASLQYGAEAAHVATTTKLVRALWIVPLAFVIGLVWTRGEGKIPVLSILKRCWFIGGFIVMAVATNYIPVAREAAPLIEMASRRLMIAVLFLIGLGLNRELIAQTGVKPFLQGVLLWLVVSAATLGAILMNLIAVR